ncbi:hypothetical protein PENSTE_c002G08252 [Penicillium steckii]|uniref:Uncharacterized protein n=1 Tax=Penicillium steckii TaxID=303698 RepID=A0A1V6TUA1_9EURO|nr:hypothetical protein PENSTE_c002G08252 [Penicillium steckii]
MPERRIHPDPTETTDLFAQHPIQQMPEKVTESAQLIFRAAQRQRTDSQRGNRDPVYPSTKAHTVHSMKNRASTSQKDKRRGEPCAEKIQPRFCHHGSEMCDKKKRKNERTDFFTPPPKSTN